MRDDGDILSDNFGAIVDAKWEGSFSGIRKVDDGKCAIDEQKTMCASSVIKGSDNKGSDNLARRVDAMGLGVDRAGNGIVVKLALLPMKSFDEVPVRLKASDDLASIVNAHRHRGSSTAGDIDRSDAEHVRLRFHVAMFPRP